MRLLVPIIELKNSTASVIQVESEDAFFRTDLVLAVVLLILFFLALFHLSKHHFMKKLAIFLIVFLPVTLLAQETGYSISSYLAEGVKAPNTHHMGDAWLNFLIAGDEEFNQNITQATFSANSTLDWHKHKTPQVLIVVEGRGYYQEKGREAIVMKKGDVIKCEKETEHWHTASAESSVAYLAIYGSQPTEWTEKLTRAYYEEVSKKLSGK